MRVLLDECANARIRRHLTSTVLKTVPEMGWAGVKNGQLLQLAASSFELFITLDGALPSQQNLGPLALAVVIVRANSNRIADLLPLVPQIQQAIATAPKGAVTYVS